MDKVILVKLHDILKLTGKSQYHYCPDFWDEINSVNPEIKKVLKHHCVSSFWRRSSHDPSCNPFPVDNGMFCLTLADVKAATISRRLCVTKYISHKTFRIWKDTKKTSQELKQEKDELKSHGVVFDDIKKIVKPNELYDRYKRDFVVRSEDAGRCPFASLHTHNELTAIWFSFFLDNSEYFDIPGEIKETRELKRVMYATSKKKISIVRIKLNTNSKLSRLRDTKLINDVPLLLEKVNDKLNGAIIYHLPEEILFITTPDNSVNIEQKVKELLGIKTNYYFEATVVDTVLSNKEFLYNYNKLFGNYEKNLYPELLPEIVPLPENEASHRAIICDMCQMSNATVVYPSEIYTDTKPELVEEFLCKGCLEIRKKADKATNLARWEDERDVGVAFFKISLDMHGLINILKDMFTAQFGFKKVFNEDLGFSILKEFLYDYEKFLDDFRTTVFEFRDYGKESNNEIIMKNLFCIKIGKDNEIKPLVNEYKELISSDKYFRQLVSFAASNKKLLPVKLSVTTSSVNYPFMEHWHVLNNPKEAINIYAVPHTRLEINLEKYRYLSDIAFEDKKISSALHKLSGIEERTKNLFLVTVAMLDMKNELKGLARHLITTKELSMNEALSYYKIMKD